MTALRCRLFVYIVLSALTGKAQEAFYDTPVIPLDTTISITLLSRDTISLDYYSLYAFRYKANTANVDARFIVPKDLDGYKFKKQVAIKLCRLTTFINSFQGTEGDPMVVEDYMEIRSTFGKHQVQHYNLDPELPDPVFTVCGTQKPARNKK